MSNTEAYVESSDHKKVYTVRFDEHIYSSNDNATMWQHYAGYPIIAVWMKQGKLKVNKSILPLFQDVNWKSLNQTFKHKYEEAIDAFFSTITCDQAMVRKVMQDTLDELKHMEYIIKGNRAKMIMK